MTEPILVVRITQLVTPQEVYCAFEALRRLGVPAADIFFQFLPTSFAVTVRDGDHEVFGIEVGQFQPVQRTRIGTAVKKFLDSIRTGKVSEEDLSQCWDDSMVKKHSFAIAANMAALKVLDRAVSGGGEAC